VSRQTTVRSVLLALDPFFELRGTMPARAIQAFLIVADKPGLSVGEYARIARCSPTTMSRNLLDLGERDRVGNEGHGLVEGRDNLANLREKVYRLTPNGEQFLTRIVNRIAAVRP
jgi:DNA-binding MarR family transcriptional regulator